MDHFEGTATAELPAAPSAVFDLITDVERLPEWNRCIARVLATPSGWEPGTTWTVQIHVPKIGRWKSISTLVEHDPAGGVFAYRSKRVDKNPTYGEWRWQLTPVDGGTRVDVRWQGHPRTFGRKYLAAPIRSRQLPGEVAASLEEIGRLLGVSSRPVP